MEIVIVDDAMMNAFGAACGKRVKGGEVFELVGDIGAGKTTFTKGLADGMGIKDDVQSPTFTINRTYEGRDDLQLSHYDFYRLEDAGIMREEIAEVMHDAGVVTVIEWSGAVSGVLPDARIVVTIRPRADDTRHVTVHAGTPAYEQIIQGAIGDITLE